MNHVEWLSNWLHSIDPTWVWIVLSWLALGLLAIAACVRGSQLPRELRRAHAYRDYLSDCLSAEVKRQEAKANSAGPQVTAKTLTEDQINEEETTE